MFALHRLWLRVSLCWKTGSSAEITRLRLLNDALHREGKLRGNGRRPYLRASDLWPHDFWSQIHDHEESAYAPCREPAPTCEHMNLLLFLTVPDSQFRVRNREGS